MDQNIIIFLILSIKALSVIFLLIALCLPVGCLLLRLFGLNYSELSLAFAFGLIFQALVVICIYYFDLQKLAYNYSYLALLPLFSLIFSKKFLSFSEIKTLIFISLSAVFFSHLMAYTGSSSKVITAESTRYLSGYYTDNLITFNTARIFTEGLDFKKIIVVPIWSFFDRTPIAGIVVSYLWFFLGIKESASWLSSSGDNFFIYQVQMIFLNLLSLLALAGILKQKINKVLPLILILIFSPFLFINLSFAWPKYFSAFFALVGVDILIRSNHESYGLKEFFFAGILLGLSFLTHDSAIFFVSTLVVVIFMLGLLKKNFIQPLTLLFGLVLTILPWFLLKANYENQSNHMLALHLLCIKDFSYQELNFSEAFHNYLSAHSFAEIIKIKIGNIFYPYSLIDFVLSLRGNYFDLFEWIKIMSVLSKYQFLHAINIIAFLSALFGFFILKTEKNNSKYLVLASILAVLPAAILFGCEKSTWNHTWIYTSSLLIMLPMSLAFRKYKILYYFSLFLSLCLTFELLLLLPDFVSIANFQFLFWALFLAGLLVILCIVDSLFAES